MFLSTAALCLALNVYHEARGEPIVGQKAVAYVTLRRANFDERNVCKEVFRPKQFSWANPLTESTPAERARLAAQFMPQESDAWTVAKRVAVMALRGTAVDMTLGADHYYNPNKARPTWRHAMKRTAKIGNHVFLASR